MSQHIMLHVSIVYGNTKYSIQVLMQTSHIKHNPCQRQNETGKNTSQKTIAKD